MNNHFAFLTAALALALGGLLNAVNDILSFTAVVTAACTGFARYTAVLLGFTQTRIERSTARGFFLGLFVSLVLLLLDRL